MQYFWIRDQNILKNFLIAWKAGQVNIEYYLTKHISAKNHKHEHLVYLQTNTTPRSVLPVLLNPSLKGCVDPEYSKMK